MNPLALFFVLMAPLLGAVVGSATNAIVPRLASGEGGWLTERSKCPHCRSVLRARHLVPVLSYLVLRGRCSACRRKIPLQYLFVELIGASAFALVAVHATSDPELHPATLAVTFLLVAVLLMIAAYDTLTMEIPFVLVLPAIALAALRAALPGAPDISSALIGAGVIGGFFLLQLLILTPLYRARMRSAGETPDGGVIGGGDALLGIVLGLSVGWPGAVVALAGAYLLGALVTVPLLLTGKAGRKSAIPFGPFLAAGALLGILWGDTLVSFYLRFIEP